MTAKGKRSTLKVQAITCKKMKTEEEEWKNINFHSFIV